jgi:hypothetical protein
VGNAWAWNIGGAVDCGGECDIHSGDVKAGGFGIRQGQDSWGFGGSSSGVWGSAAAAAGVEVVACPSWGGCLCGVRCVTKADHILTQPEGTNEKIQYDR